jgi:DME family drug/metabolite transporter
VAATAVAVAGCGLLVAGVQAADAVGGQAGAGARVVGVVLALGAGASYALYTVAAKGLMDAGLPPTAAVALLFGLGALAVSPLLGARPPAGAGATAVYLGLVTVVVAYLLYGAGLRVLPASTVASLSLAEPLTAGLLGTVVLGERLSPAGAAGALAILAGLTLLVTSPSTA